MNPSLAYRFFHRPLAIAPQFAAPLAQAVARSEDEKSASVALAVKAADRPPYMLIGDIAVVPVSGTLVHSYDWYGQTSYDDISMGVLSAVSNNAVRAICLQIASPGGEVDGCFECADLIYSLRGEKPIWAIADPYCYSAAYALASAADSIFLPATGGVGSVGVVALHVEFSKMLAEQGINVTVIQYGERKTERGPFAPLSDEARDRIQADIDAVGEIFVDTVARNRAVSTAAVSKTQAGTFMGQAAVDAKLADAVCPPQEAFVLLQSNLLAA